MSVIKRNFGGQLGFFLIVLFFFYAFSFGEQEAGQSLVKVYLNREFLGLLHDNKLIPQTRIQEIAEFKGAVFDRRGHIVSYVGSYVRDFSVPGVQLTVETSGGERHPARLVGVDERIALAVLEAQQAVGFALNFGASLQEKRPLFVLSGPQGWQFHSPALVSVREGNWLPEEEVHVSGLSARAGRRAWEGGFVLDEKGRLLGILTRIERHPLSRKIEICRILPAEVIRGSVNRILKEKRNISAGWLGVLLEPGAATKSRMGPRLKLKIRNVVAGSPAQKAGLKPGDAVLEIENRPLADLQELVRAIQWRGAGNELTLSVESEGRIRTVAARLSERQDPEPVVSWALEIPRLWEGNTPTPENIRMYRTVLPASLRLGFEVEPLTPQLADYFRIPKGRGLLVKSVLEGGLAQTVGFLAGDVLIQINGEEVATPADVQQSLRSSQEGILVIQFVRDRKVKTHTLVLP